MARGRQRKPTHLKVIEGNRGKRAVNTSEPEFPRGVPEPMNELRPAARKVWDKYAPMLLKENVLTLADGLQFEILCDAYADVIEAREVLDDAGVDYETCGPSGTVRRTHPAYARMTEAIRRLQSAIGEMGMSPASRSKVKRDLQGDLFAEDPSEKYFD